MTTRDCVRAALCIMLPAMLAAQEPQHGLRPRTLIASLGVGSGSAAFSCDACPSGRDAGIASLFRLGIAVRSNLAVGADVSTWTKHYSEADRSAAARFRFVDATAQWYPRPAARWFVKAGVGRATIEDDITSTTLGRTTISTTTGSFVLGAGWHRVVRPKWALTPYLDFNYAARAAQSMNGVNGSEQLGGSVWHFGMAVTRGVPAR